MKNLYIALFFIAGLAVAQENVGINTTSPNATLEIKAATDGSTTPEGLLIPNLTDAQIQAMPVSNIHSGMMIYNSTEDCLQTYANSQWQCISLANNSGLSAYLNATYTGSTGTWVQDYTADGNTISFKISNNSNLSFSRLNFNDAVELTNAHVGISYTPAADYNNITIDAGSVSTFTYNISGTPTTAGTLTANFNGSGGISTYGNISISPKSPVQALTIEFIGDYISNRQLDFSDHSLQLTVKNNSLNPVSNIDLSNAISLSGVTGLTIQPNQNMGVNIPANSQVMLTYQIGGVLPKLGTVTATFTANEAVSGTVSTDKSIPLFRNATASNLVINGTYLYGQIMSPENNISLTLTNNNIFDLKQIDLSDALAISGAVNNIAISPNQNTAINIPANSSIAVLYLFTGTSIVQGGGMLTANFAQTPFPTLTATKNVLGNNNFYATPNSTTLPSTGGSYTFNINSSEAWVVELLGDASNWMTITNTTGTSGNGTISISTQPKTSQHAQLGYIRISRPNDGTSIRIAINQEPTDSFAIVDRRGFVLSNARIMSKHSYNLYILETNQTDFEIYGELPAFIESYTINGNNVIFVPKERTISGENMSGTIRFSYGAGYISDLIILGQAKKAYQCPANAPVRADNGYKIWNSVQPFPPSILYTLIETRGGIDDFSDYTTPSSGNLTMYTNSEKRYFGIKKNIIQNNGSSTLFVDFNNRSFDSNDRHDGWSSVNDKYILIYQYDKVVKGFIGNTENPSQIPDLSSSVVISPVICVDGYDEDTPDVSGAAGWRN